MKLRECVGAESPTVDTITMDVPLFIRMLEWAREDAQSDVELHQAAENAVRLGKDGCGHLRIRDYLQVIASVPAQALPADKPAPEVPVDPAPMPVTKSEPNIAIAAENGQAPAGEYFTPDQRRWVHGEKYRVIGGSHRGHVVRVVSRANLQPTAGATYTDVAVQFPHGGIGFISEAHLDHFVPGATDYTEPVRSGFPY